MEKSHTINQGTEERAFHETTECSLTCLSSFPVHHLLFLPSHHLQGYMEQDVYNILLRILSIQEE